MTTHTDLTAGELAKRFTGAPPVGSHWVHTKGGRYVVTGHVVIEKTREPAVAYRCNDLVTWVRPLAEFMDGRFSPTVPPEGVEDDEEHP